MLRLTINGKDIEAAEGTSVLKAAQDAGFYVPTLCTHQHLRPFGACRLCIVEIEGMRGFPTSCTTPATNGMKVKTESEEIRKKRVNILEFILSEHPASCLFCPEKEKCGTFQSCIRKVGTTTGCNFCPKKDTCELRAVVEHVGITEVRFPYYYRGLPVERNDPFFDRDYNLCILCGRCVRVCNDVRGYGCLAFLNRGDRTIVGTAFGDNHRISGCAFCGACVDSCPVGALAERSNKWEGKPDRSVESLCPFCSVGCGVSLEVKNKRLSGIKPSSVSPVNEGMLCVKGRFAALELLKSSKRILSPMVKKNGVLHAVSWDEALTAAADKLKGMTGSEIALVASPNLTNEDNFVLKRFADTVTKGAKIYSALSPLPGNSLQDTKSMGGASAIFLISADLSQSHPLLEWRIKQAVDRGAKLIGINSRGTLLSRIAALWLSVPPGKEMSLLTSALKAKPPRKPASMSKDDWPMLRASLSENPVVMIYGKDIINASSRDLSGFLTRKGWYLLPAVGDGNNRGGLDIFDGWKGPAGTAQKTWSGGIKALFAIGASLPRERNVIEFVVSQTSFVSGEALEADIVLPSAIFTEIDGTYTNMEGRVQRLRKALEPAGMSRPDWWILSELAKKLGVTKGFEFTHSSEIMDEIARAIPAYSGISYGAIEKNGPMLTAKRGGEETSAAGGITIGEHRSAGYKNASLLESVRGMKLVWSGD